MWDAGLTTRIRDRKLNEILSFAAMMRVYPSNRDVYVEIIDMLNRDIDVCDALLSSEGSDAPTSVPIDAEEYLSRLTEAESADESRFDSYRVLPESEPPVEEADVVALVTAALSEAVDRIVEARSVAATADGDVVPDLMEELRCCRERVEQLSGTLDYTRSELQASEDEIGELESQLQTYSKFNQDLMDDVQSLKDRLAESVLERDGLVDDIAVHAEETEALNARIHELEHELAETDRARLLSEESVNEALAQSSAKDSRISELETLLIRNDEASKAEMESRMVMIDELRSQLDALKTSRDEESADKDARIARLESFVSDLRDDNVQAVEERDTRINELQALLNERTEAYESEREALRKASETIESLREDLNDVNAELEETSSELEDVSDDYEATLVKHSRIVASMDERIAEAQTVIADLKSSGSAMSARNAELEAELEEARILLRSKEGELEDLVADGSAALAERDGIISALRAELADVTGARASLVMDNETLSRTVDELKTGYAAREEAYNDLRAELETVRRDNEAIVSERDDRIRELKHQVLVGRETAVVMEERISALAARLNDYGDVPELKMDLSRSIMDNESLQVENEELKVAICQVTDRIRDLEEESISRSEEFKAEREENERLVRDLRRQILGYKGTIDILEDKVERLAGRLSEVRDARSVPEGTSAVEPVMGSVSAERVDMILTEEQRDALRTASEMKNSKIDYFVDMSFSGRFNEDACEHVIDFLKVDLSIIDLLLSMDETDRGSIESTITGILGILDASADPKHQKMYVNSLTAEQKLREAAYNEVLAHVEDVINTRYSSLVS